MGVRVLIAEDSALMRALLERALSTGGYEVVGAAQDGEQALEMFRNLKPDLVLLDIIMPKLRGTEVLKTIISEDPTAKVIMASSISDAKTVMNCLKTGARRYITKPYNEEKILKNVRKVLGGEKS